MMKRITALIHGSRTLEASEKLLGAAECPELIIEVDADINQEHLPHTVNVWQWNELLTENEQHEIGDYVRRLQGEWFCIEGKDQSIWEGYSLGECYTGPRFVNKITPVLINLKIFSRLKSCFDLEKIYLGYGTGLDVDVWLKVCELEKIECEVLPVDFKLQRLKQQQKVEKRTIWSYFNGHFKSIKNNSSLPGAKLVKGKKPVVLVAEDNLGTRMPWIINDLKRSGKVEVMEAKEVMPQFLKSVFKRRAVKAARERLQKRWGKLNEYQHKNKKLEWCGVNWWAMCEQWLNYEFCIQLSRAAGRIAHAKELIKQIQPVCLLTEAQVGNDSYCWAAVGIKEGLPVIAHQNEVWMYAHKPHRHYKVPLADYILTVSRLAIPWFLKNQYNNEQLIPVEDPRVRGALEAVNGHRKRRPDTKRLKVLFAAGRTAPFEFGVSPWHNRKLLSSVLEIAQSSTLWDFAFKLHPRMNLADGAGAEEDYKRLIQEAGAAQVEVVDTSREIRDILKDIDLVIMGISDVTWEALTMGVRAIVCPPSHMMHQYEDLDHPLLYTCTNFNDLPAIVNQAGSDVFADSLEQIPLDLLKNRCFVNGKASDAIESLVKKIEQGVVLARM